MTELSRGAELRRLRNQAGLSLWDVARPAGIKANTLSLIERDCQKASDELYERLRQTILGIATGRADAVSSLVGVGGPS